MKLNLGRDSEAKFGQDIGVLSEAEMGWVGLGGTTGTGQIRDRCPL